MFKNTLISFRRFDDPLLDWFACKKSRIAEHYDFNHAAIGNKMIVQLKEAKQVNSQENHPSSDLDLNKKREFLII